MSIRETLSTAPQKGLVALVTVVLIVVGVVVWSNLFSGPRSPSMPSKIYFTDDDGKTFYPDSSANIAPYDRAGKQALQVAVFQCDSKPPFVGYLIRYSNSAKAALEAMPEADRMGTNSKALQIRQSGAMVKKAGDKDWLALTGDRPIGQIVSPTCPDGSEETPKQVLP